MDRSLKTALAARARRVEQQDLVRAAWTRGVLSYKLDSDQRLIYDGMKACKRMRKTLRCSRKWGKSLFGLVKGLEGGIQHPGERVNYAAQTSKLLKEVLEPLFYLLTADCPRDLRPEWKNAGHIEFKKGARLVMAGCETRDKMERLRGPESPLSILDEAGAVRELGYLYGEIIKPQHLMKDGEILVLGTPPPSTDHQFVNFCLQAEAEGSGWHRTLFQNPRVKDKIEAWIAESAAEQGMTVDEYRNSVAFRREYLAEFIGDPEKLVLPSFTEQREAEIVRILERPPFFDTYSVMDVGHREDWTALLWAYWHYDLATLVIEDELLMRRMTTPELAAAIRKKEFDLYGENARIFRRISDIAPQVQADLAQLHGFVFSDTSKDDKDAAINQVQMAINGQRGKLAIHPRCVNLIRQMKQCTWNKARTTFERTDTNGHYDLVDTLIYLVRNVQRSKNPYPEGYGMPFDAQVGGPKAPPPIVKALRGNMNSRRILGGLYRGGR